MKPCQSPQNRLANSNQKGASPLRKRRGGERVGELAVLPVFYKLKGRQVVVANGTDAAAWKAELMLAAGARVRLYAVELDEAFDPLIEQYGAQLEIENRPWGQDCFDLATLAICDAESDGEAQAFYCAAKAAGVPVNVIDRPRFCQFQFGSIVNRSPAVIGISTDGAAPILGQAMRRRIETLLPQSISDWAGVARDLRDKVSAHLEMGAPRRRFWERFVDLAFGGETTDTSDATAEDVFQRCQREATPKGKVTLVGAGPGDAELLTLKAVRALQGADVILFDDLVGDDVLELARREAKRMLVGKRGGRESCKQDDINATMLKLAQAGKNVVRLKSGDPMIFGRAGEEVAFLERAGVETAVVPGITAASAMASQLGVSLTHRDHARSVRLITGHSRHGQLPTDINWQEMASNGTTNVFYMAGRTAKQLEQKLLEGGMEASTPVAICASVSRKETQQWIGSLSQLGAGIDVVGYENPVLIGVGETFAAARQQVPALANALPGGFEVNLLAGNG
ncbi:MAG: uroporphyrinogen-III C-methyltransferase [Rhizobiaceae bacterium]|nr:uroporphyrinogen-III C-methyltransferase [Rhizobiaceae bacterium]